MNPPGPGTPIEAHPVIERAIRAMPLSKREVAVVRLLVAGKSTAEVAEALGIRQTTVFSHLRKVFSQAGVRSRSQLLAAILHHALTEFDRRLPPKDTPSDDSGQPLIPAPLAGEPV